MEIGLGIFFVIVGDDGIVVERDEEEEVKLNKVLIGLLRKINCRGATTGTDESVSVIYPKNKVENFAH